MTGFDTLVDWKIENPREVTEVEKAVFGQENETLFVQNWEEGYEVVWYTDSEPLDVVKAADQAYPVNRNVDCTFFDGAKTYSPPSKNIRKYEFGLCQNLNLSYDLFDVRWSNYEEAGYVENGEELYEAGVYCMENSFEPVRAIYPKTSYTGTEEEDVSIILADVKDYLRQGPPPESDSKLV